MYLIYKRVLKMTNYVPRRIESSFWTNFKKSSFKINANDIKILYKSKHFIAIDKPYGIPVHSGPKVVRSIEEMLPSIQQKLGLENRLFLGHRLDRDCTGILLLSFDKDSANFLSESFEKDQIQKQYLTILLGIPKTISGTIDVPLTVKREINHEKQKFSDFKARSILELKSIQNEDPSLLPRNVLSAFSEYNLISKWISDNNSDYGLSVMIFNIKTGRKHQVRAHASQVLQCPILGDHKFSRTDRRPQKIPLDIAKFLGVGKTWSASKIPLHLHSHRIVIPDGPSNSSKMVEIISTIPEHMKRTIKAFNLLNI